MRIYIKDKKRLGFWLRLPNRLLLNSLTAEIAVRVAKAQGGVRLDKKELLQMMKELRLIGKRRPRLELVDLSAQDGSKVKIRL